MSNAQTPFVQHLQAGNDLPIGNETVAIGSLAGINHILFPAILRHTIPYNSCTFLGTLAGGYTTTISPTRARNIIFASTYVGANTGENCFGDNNCHYGTGAANGSVVLQDYGENNCFYGRLSGEANTGDQRFPTIINGVDGISLGSNNSFYGFQSGRVNSIGSVNVFIGNNAGFSNTTGNGNVFLGRSAGFNIITGNHNVALGTHSGLNTPGNSTNSISIGAFANVGQSNSMQLGAIQGTTGFGFMRVGINTATPTHQLHIANSTGATDVNSGAATDYARVRFDRLPLTTDNLEFVVTGTNGVLYRRTVNLAPFVGCTTVGFIPRVNNVNGNMECSQIFDNATSVAIGWAAPGGPPVGFANYSGVTTNITPGSIVPPATGIARLVVNGVTMTHGVSYTSDKRFKKDINPVTNSLDKIKQLNGVTYNWRKEDFKDKNFDGLNQIGFIAQDVEKVIPQAVIKDAEGYYAMNYTMLIPVLTEAMKEQQKMIESQQKEIDELKALVKGTTPKSILENPVKTIQLFQNVPNPFSKETDIKFYLPETVKQANLTIYDMQGKQLRKIEINERNEASIKINGKELPAGMYMYSLIADGKEMDTKRMILTDY